MCIRDRDVLEQILTEVGTDVLAKYIGTTNNSYRNNMERVYDVIKGDPYNAYATYDNLKDPDRVLQQIASQMASDMIKGCLLYTSRCV